MSAFGSPQTLAAALALAAAQLTALGLFLRRLRTRAAPGAGAPPSAAVIVPCAGPVADLEGAVRSYLAQDYPGRVEFLFVTPSASDPSHAALERLLAGEPRARLLASEVFPTRCSGKCADLAFAVRSAGSCELLVFADADQRVPRGWLRALTAPLADASVAAATSAALPVPRAAAPASWLHAAWQGFGLPYLALSGSVCGQSLALRRADFESWGVAELWERSFSDDLSLSVLLARRGARVRFVGEAMPEGGSPSSLAGVFALTSRWFFTFRVYRPGVWGMGLALVFAKLWLLAWALGAPVSWGLLSLLCASDAVAALFLAAPVGKGSAARAALALLSAAAAVPLILLQAAGLASSALRVEVRWGTRRYRVLGPADVCVLEGPPFVSPELRAVLGGAAAAASYLFPALGVLGFFCYVPLLAFAREGPPRRAFLLGWLYGLSMWGFGLLWFVETLRRFLSMGAFEAALLLLPCALYHGLLPALVCALLASQPLRLRARAALFVPAAAALWACAEALFPTLFPYSVGASAASHLPFAQALEFVGLGGLCAAVLLVNGLVLSGLEAFGRRERRAAAAALCVALTLAAALEASGRARMARIDARVFAALARGEGLRVVAVQGAFPGGWRLRDGRRSPERFEAYRDSTAGLRGRGGADLVVWPEYSYPGVVSYASPADPSGARLDGPEAAALMSLLPRGADLLLSSEARRAGSRGVAAFLLGPSGSVLGVSEKSRLVPFGEYLPVPGLDALMARLSPRTERMSVGRPGLLRTRAGVRVGTLICYEDLSPPAARELAAAGAELFASVGSDAWFVPAAARLHLRQSVLRAVENRRFLVRALDDGCSAVVDPVGRVLVGFSPEEAGALGREVARSSGATWYARAAGAFGRRPAVLVVLLFVLAVLAPRRPEH
ncbi:MAG: apolipoprotein N-acyltransferase [Elusimicrobiota bacterium]